MMTKKKRIVLFLLLIVPLFFLNRLVAHYTSDNLAFWFSILIVPLVGKFIINPPVKKTKENNT
jgi:hypothetical protein